MQFLDDGGLGQIQDIGIALEVAVVVGEPRAAIRLLVQLLALDQGAHGAVENEDALGQEPGNGVGAKGPRPGNRGRGVRGELVHPDYSMDRCYFLAGCRPRIRHVA